MGRVGRPIACRIWIPEGTCVNDPSVEGPPSDRQLGFWSTVALVVGHTIGVGVFLTPAELIGALASPALILGLWLACGTLVLFGAFTFGELVSRYPQSGGLYVYLREG